MNSPEKTNCRQCWQEFGWMRHDYYSRSPDYCESCAAIIVQKKYQEACSKAEAEIADITPKRFLTTDTGHPDFNFHLWQGIEGWRPCEERPWLGPVGQTGTSKTRCAFMLMREITLAMIHPPPHPDYMTWRPSIAVTSACRFAETVMAQFSDNTKEEAHAVLRRFRKVDVLLIDDLGKQRNTPAVAGELFALLDHRHAENLCTIWTANSAPEKIVAGMNEDMAAPLAGRIRECSKRIIIE